MGVFDGAVEITGLFCGNGQAAKGAQIDVKKPLPFGHHPVVIVSGKQGALIEVDAPGEQQGLSGWVGLLVRGLGCSLKLAHITDYRFRIQSRT